MRKSVTEDPEGLFIPEGPATGSITSEAACKPEGPAIGSSIWRPKGPAEGPAGVEGPAEGPGVGSTPCSILSLVTSLVEEKQKLENIVMSFIS